jgi:hypothetical protein
VYRNYWSITSKQGPAHQHMVSKNKIHKIHQRNHRRKNIINTCTTSEEHE